MSVAEILPSNSGPFERVLAAGLSDNLPVPFRDILDPAKTPVEWLPWLAAHESVDLWFSDWSEERKRQMIADAPRLAQLIGTRAAAERFLAYVDTLVVHKVSYPATQPVGRIAVRRTPIQHKPFVARFLLKTDLRQHRRAVCVGRSAVGRAAVITINREPLRRVKTALTASKSPDTAFSVNFAHRIPITLDDGLDLDAGSVLGQYKDRNRL